VKLKPKTYLDQIILVGSLINDVTVLGSCDKYVFVTIVHSGVARKLSWSVQLDNFGLKALLIL
jgi:hypothetical protein